LRTAYELANSTVPDGLHDVDPVARWIAGPAPPGAVTREPRLNEPLVFFKRPPVLLSMLAVDVVVGRPGAYCAFQSALLKILAGDYDGDVPQISSPQTLAGLYNAKAQFSPTRLPLRWQSGSDLGLLQDMIVMWTRMTLGPPLPWLWFIRCICALECYAGQPQEVVIEKALQRRLYTDRTFTVRVSPFPTLWYTRQPLRQDGSNYLECGWDVRDLLFHWLPSGFCYRRMEYSSPGLPSVLPAVLPVLQSDACEGTTPRSGCEVHIDRGWLLHGILTKADLGTGFNVMTHQMAMSFGTAVTRQFVDDATRLCFVFNHLAPWGLALDDRWLDLDVWRSFTSAIHQFRVNEQLAIARLQDKLDRDRARFLDTIGGPAEGAFHGKYAMQSFEAMQTRAQQATDVQILELAQIRSDGINDLMKKFIKNSAKTLPRYRNRVVLKSKDPRLADWQLELNRIILAHALPHHPRPLVWTVTVHSEDEFKRVLEQTRIILEFSKVTYLQSSLDEQARDIWSSLFEGWSLIGMIFAGSKGKATDAIDATVGLELQMSGDQLMGITPDGRITCYDAHADGVDARGAAYDDCYNKGFRLKAGVKHNVCAGFKVVLGQSTVFVMGVKHRNISNVALDIVQHHDGTIRDSSGSLISLSLGMTGSSGVFEIKFPLHNVVQDITFFLTQAQTLCTRFQPGLPWMVQPLMIQEAVRNWITTKFFRPVLSLNHAPPSFPVQECRLTEPYFEGSDMSAFFSSPLSTSSSSSSSSSFSASSSSASDSTDQNDSIPRLEQDKDEPIEQMKEEDTLHSDWDRLVTLETRKRLAENAMSEAQASIDELQDMMKEAYHLQRHLSGQGQRRIPDPIVRVPFLIHQEIHRMFSKVPLATQQVDMLPSEIIAIRTALIQRIHSEGHTLYTAMKKHRFHLGQRIVQWHILDELNCKHVYEKWHLTRVQLEELCQHLFQRFQQSRSCPGDLVAVKASMSACEPLEQSTLNLKHTLNNLVSNTEGIPRFGVLVGCTQSLQDLIVTVQLRKQEHVSTRTGITTVWQHKPGLSETQQVVAHFSNLDSRFIFTLVKAVDYREDLEAHLSDSTADWEKLTLDGDEADWAFPRSTRDAFMILIDVRELVHVGGEPVSILQRTRAGLDYAFVLSALVSVSKEVIRVYGRLVAANDQIEERMRQAEKGFRLVGHRICPTQVVHQYVSARFYLDRTAQNLVRTLLPRTHVTKVAFQPETRVVSMLLSKSIHTLQHLYVLASRPEFVPHTFRYADSGMRVALHGIEATRRELAREFVNLVHKIQYITPSMCHILASIQTVDGKLVPLDWRYFQQRVNTDALTKGAINRGRAANQEAALQGPKTNLNHVQTAQMFGRPAAVGTHFQSAQLTTSQQFTNQVGPIDKAEAIQQAAEKNQWLTDRAAGVEEERQFAKLVPLATYAGYLAKNQIEPWNPEFNDFFGTESFATYFRGLPRQYVAEEAEDMSEAWVQQALDQPEQDGLVSAAGELVSDPEAALLLQRQVLTVADIQRVQQAWSHHPVYDAALEHCFLREGALQVAVCDYWPRVAALSWSRWDPATTEVEARIVSETKASSLDNAHFLQLCHELGRILEQPVRIRERTDHAIAHSGSLSTTSPRYRIEDEVEMASGLDEDEATTEDDDTASTASEEELDKPKRCPLVKMVKDQVWTRKFYQTPVSAVSTGLFGIRLAVMDEVSRSPEDWQGLHGQAEFDRILQLTPDTGLSVRNKVYCSFDLDEVAILTLDRTVDHRNKTSFHVEIELKRGSLEPSVLYVFCKYVFLFGNLVTLLTTHSK